MTKLGTSRQIPDPLVEGSINSRPSNCYTSRPRPSRSVGLECAFSGSSHFYFRQARFVGRTQEVTWGCYRNLRDVARGWLAPADRSLRAESRMIAVNEAGGFVYELGPDRHRPQQSQGAKEADRL
jgi:hypothetical protein